MTRMTRGMTRRGHLQGADSFGEILDMTRMTPNQAKDLWNRKGGQRGTTRRSEVTIGNAGHRGHTGHAPWCPPSAPFGDLSPVSLPVTGIVPLTGKMPRHGDTMGPSGGFAVRGTRSPDIPRHGKILKSGKPSGENPRHGE